MMTATRKILMKMIFKIAFPYNDTLNFSGYEKPILYWDIRVKYVAYVILLNPRLELENDCSFLGSKHRSEIPTASEAAITP